MYSGKAQLIICYPGKFDIKKNSFSLIDLC